MHLWVRGEAGDLFNCTFHSGHFNESKLILNLKFRIKQKRIRRTRTKQKSRISTGAKAPRKQKVTQKVACKQITGRLDELQ